MTTNRGNAGKPWTVTEDKNLAYKFNEGLNLSDLADKHGRTRAAIAVRLVRLNLIVVVQEEGVYRRIGEVFCKYQDLAEGPK